MMTRTSARELPNYFPKLLRECRKKIDRRLMLSSRYSYEHISHFTN